MNGGCCVCFFMQVVIDKHPVRFFVHKRPHVDFFLEVVSVSLWSVPLLVCLKTQISMERNGEARCELHFPVVIFAITLHCSAFSHYLMPYIYICFGLTVTFMCSILCVFAQVSQWYELVVFTASMEIYGSAVADKLDNNRNILKRRYYRQVLL